MNIQELIERMKGFKKIFNNKVEYIELDTAIELISRLDEPEKVQVPQFIADWYEEHKDDFETNLFRAVDLIPSDYEKDELSEFEEWLVDEHTAPFQTLVNMHQFGYTVEKEKRYRVKVKRVSGEARYLNHEVDGDWYINNKQETHHFKVLHTRKELEQAGFSWVFDCPGMEVEEVE